jgi:small-conductance mechanosensitive channel
LDFDGIRLIGVNNDTAFRALLTLAAVAVIVLFRVAIVWAIHWSTRRHPNDRVMFWTRQASSLAAFVLMVFVTISIWVDNPARLTTVAGIATAGLAIAAQRVITAFAGYLLIMRGKTFTVGDRIKMGGVRGDVIALGFLQTRILEMGQPPDVNEQEEPGMWVRARQYSGRIVTVTNDKVFDEPVYNFSRELPFIWEEISVGIGYHADHAHAERILLETAAAATTSYEKESAAARAAFEAKYNVALDQSLPRVYWRLTDNWVELTVRFIVPEHGIRDVKDAMARRIMQDFNSAHLQIASTSFEIVGLPPLHITRTGHSSLVGSR